MTNGVETDSDDPWIQISPFLQIMYCGTGHEEQICRAGRGQEMLDNTIHNIFHLQRIGRGLEIMDGIWVLKYLEV